MKVRIYPYKQGSKSAGALAEALNGRVLKLQGSKFKPKKDDLIINWGAGRVPAFPCKVLNPDVETAQNKLLTFRKLSDAGISVPPWTEDKAHAKAEFACTVCRTVLRGHSGAGIVIAETPDEVVDAPLYTKYVKKQDEYRVHVFGEEAFFIQRKAKKNDVENPNWKVRNLDGGFVFVEAKEEDTPQGVISEAVSSIAALGLDFGGVDVIWNSKEQKAYVLEINTACGLEERTAGKYAEILGDYLQNQG